ncbi:MAG: hypothetical protein DRH90_04930 [Deltaproteobacteria bacterium]|nr:MAG: hypothetical protein DRH90_04930 [Deltaproteobacteria bacterium]RLC18791.1 MAG: hypothetical protein DRI24_02105 [Deltaproteobacteria bacterium]
MTPYPLKLFLYPVFLKVETLILGLIIGTAMCLLPAGKVLSQEAIGPLTGHAFYGKMIIPNNNSDIEGNDFDINIFGADAQSPYGGGLLKYGIETGAIFSIDSNVKHFRASSGRNGGTVAVAAEVDFFMMDYFFGGYLGLEPSKWLRLYVGAGPLLIWGMQSTDPKKSDSEEVNSNSEIEFGAGLYARAGIDIFLSEQFGLNMGARINETTLSFDDTAGNVDIEGLQYYFGIAFRF